MEWFVAAAVLGAVVAGIAWRKGLDYGFWWMTLYYAVVGALFVPFALAYVLIKQRDVREIERRALQAGMRRCPWCAEVIRGEARVCRFCGREVE